MSEEKVGFVVPVALREVMERLVPDFERESGCRVEVAVMLNPEVPGYVATGAPWAVALTNPWHVEEILAGGHGAPGSHRPFARSPLAFGMRGDAAAGCRRSRSEIAAMLRAADSIAVTATGTSGKTFRRLTASLGIDESVRPKLRLMPGGGPMAALIAGEVAVAALPLTNIAPVPGVFAAAICPVAFDVHIDLSLCVSRDASAAALAFADWLIDPARDAVLDRLGAERFSLDC